MRPNRSSRSLVERDALEFPDDACATDGMTKGEGHRARAVAESTLIADRGSAATTGVERIFAEVLADVLRVDRVSVDCHFFDELGADSLVMAHFCARVRKRGNLPSVSMKDVYRHPTIRSLAAALADVAPSSATSSVVAASEVATPTSTLEYVLCRVPQLLFFLGYAYVAALAARRVPVCTDLLTIGAGTVIRRESFFLCYRAHAGRIETGAVTLGRNVFIGEKTVLDINTSMGDGAQLGHASALHSGQAVPDGERWHGSPAQRTELNYLRLAPAPCGPRRRASFCAITLLSVFLLYLPLIEGGLYLLAAVAPSLGKVLNPSVAASAGVVTLRGLFIGALAVSLLFFFGAVLVGLLLVVTVPRVLNRFLKPDTVYPLYGFHDRVHRVITRLTTIKFFVRLFGDSSYVVHYLSCLGYRLFPFEQTGSNFGNTLTQANAYLCS